MVDGCPCALSLGCGSCLAAGRNQIMFQRRAVLLAGMGWGP